MQMPQPSERRAHDRAELQVKVEYQRLEDFVEDYTVNISKGGMALQTDHKLEVGDSLEVQLCFPGLLAPIRVNGEVRWVQDDPQSDLRTAGVAFRHADQADCESFERMLERVLAGDREIVAAATVRVLVADSNPHVAPLVEQGLRGHSKRGGTCLAFEAVSAADAGQALRMLEQQQFDLLVIDLQLALISGEALIGRIRSDRRWERLPIVAVGEDAEPTRQRALAAGADAYLTKPLRLVNVIEAVQRLIAL